MKPTDDRFVNVTEFTALVEEYLDMNPEDTVLDAITDTCELLGMEVESAAEVLSADLKERLRADAMKRNMIAKRPTLDI
jgi:hypothetical protein